MEFARASTEFDPLRRLAVSEKTKIGAEANA